MFIGFGTVINMGTIVLGSLVGVAVGGRLPERTRLLVTQTMGLLTVVLGGFSMIAVTDRPLTDLVGRGAIVILTLGLLFGALIGSGLRLGERLTAAGEWVQVRLQRGAETGSTFAEGLVTATLVYCIGPLAILGSLSDGLGRGSEQLVVKAVLDGFFSVALAASLGLGVLFSAVAVGIWQGVFTVLGYWAGEIIPPAEISALTAAGGIMLIALGLRICGIMKVEVADLLPALVTTPLLVTLVSLTWSG